MIRNGLKTDFGIDLCSETFAREAKVSYGLRPCVSYQFLHYRHLFTCTIIPCKIKYGIKKCEIK